jgi:hypothetical protein
MYAAGKKGRLPAIYIEGVHGDRTLFKFKFLAAQGPLVRPLSVNMNSGKLRRLLQKRPCEFFYGKSYLIRLRHGTAQQDFPFRIKGRRLRPKLENTRLAFVHAGYQGSTPCMTAAEYNEKPFGEFIESSGMTHFFCTEFFLDRIQSREGC